MVLFTDERQVQNQLRAEHGGAGVVGPPGDNVVASAVRAQPDLRWLVNSNRQTPLDEPRSSTPQSIPGGELVTWLVAFPTMFTSMVTVVGGAPGEEHAAVEKGAESRRNRSFIAPLP
jgi:hypothetical protein